MTPDDIKFMVNEYDFENGLLAKGVYIRIGETYVKVSDTIRGFKDVVTWFEEAWEEIEANYKD